MSRPSGRHLVTRLALGVVLVLVAGCSALPESGPVEREKGATAIDVDGSSRFSAPGPGEGDSPVEIANGFLLAMTANPTTTSVARSFLAKTAQAGWNPTHATVVYRASTVEQGPGSEVEVGLSDAELLDARGGWLGTAPASDGHLHFRMVRQGGEWRIADPPDSVMIPDWFLEQSFQPYNLYYFDQTERVLVPDRVYIPRGAQTSSQLVRALLAGPGPTVAPVVRTEFPTQAELGLSVLVRRNGTADVPLTKQMLQLSPGRLTRAAAQLAWTLRQVPGVNRLRMTVDETPIALPDGRQDFSVESGNAYGPSVARARTQLYGIRKGRVVVGDEKGQKPVSGPFGRTGLALRSLAVRLDGGGLVGVAEDGRTLFGGAKSPQSAGSTGQETVRRIYEGRNLLRPGYDMFGTLWCIDSAGGAAKVLAMQAGHPRARPVAVPGITGADVRSFLVSRDGTRLVAVVRQAGQGGPGSSRPARDRLVAVDLVRTPEGSVLRASDPRTVTTASEELRDVRDIVWRSPNDLAVLTRPAKGVSEVVYVSLDGSPGDPRTVPPDTWPGSSNGLVGAPDSTLPLYLETPGGALLRLDDSSRWRASGIAKGLTAPTYVG